MWTIFNPILIIILPLSPEFYHASNAQETNKMPSVKSNTMRHETIYEKCSKIQRIERHADRFPDKVSFAAFVLNIPYLNSHRVLCSL